jgi:hypothetical protein
MAIATTSWEAITYTGNFMKDSNTPRWNNRTAKYLTAQTVFDKRAVERQRTGKKQFTQQQIRTGAAASGKIRVQTHNDNRSDMQNSEERAQRPSHAQSSSQNCRRMYLNRRIQGKTNTDQKLQPASKAKEEQDARKQSGSTRNDHAIRNRESDPERNQRGKRAAEDGERNRAGNQKRK